MQLTVMHLHVHIIPRYEGGLICAVIAGMRRLVRRHSPRDIDVGAVSDGWLA